MEIKFSADQYREAITKKVVADFVSEMLKDHENIYVDLHDDESPLSYYRLRVINTPAGPQLRLSIVGNMGDSTAGYYLPDDIVSLHEMIIKLFSNSHKTAIHSAMVTLRRRNGKSDMPIIKVSLKKYSDNPRVYNPYAA